MARKQIRAVKEIGHRVDFPRSGAARPVSATNDGHRLAQKDNGLVQEMVAVHPCDK
jgi:hypothetical protein